MCGLCDLEAGVGVGWSDCIFGYEVRFGGHMLCVCVCVGKGALGGYCR